MIDLLLLGYVECENFMAYRSCALAVAFLVVSGCGKPQNASPPPESVAPATSARQKVSAQVTELREKLRAWQGNRGKLSGLLVQLQRDRVSILERIDRLEEGRQKDAPEDPGIKVLIEELRDIMRQSTVAEKKLQEYDLAILKSESRLRGIERQLAAQEAGIDDSQLMDLTRSMIALDESLASERQVAVPQELDEALMQQLASYRQQKVKKVEGAQTIESPVQVRSQSKGMEPAVISTTKPTSTPVSLFNGKDLTGWIPVFPSYAKKQINTAWVADPKRKVLMSLGGDFNDLQSEQRFQDFLLTLEWRFRPKGPVSPNGSGVIVRVQGMDQKGHNPRGIEVDFRPEHDESKGQGTGCFLAYSTTLRNHKGFADGVAVRNLGRIAEPPIKSPNQWNQCEVMCHGDRIRVMMNGVLVNEGWDAERVTGHICLRNQNSAVEFRNILVKTIAD